MTFPSLLAIAAFSACTAVPVSPNDPDVMGADDSASIQNAVDKAARSGSGRVVIPARNARTGADGWTISRAVLLPSNMTVEIDGARLSMADGVYENFFRTANVWTDEGRLPRGVVTNVAIVGKGGAVLDGAKANDLNEATSLKDGRPHVRANCPILFVNVADFKVSGLTIENHRYWGMCFCFCQRGRISDIRFVALFDRRNQDGINLRDGCRDVEIENVSGQTGDDMIALSAIDSPRYGMYSTWVEGLSPDIRNVRIRNIRGAAVGHPLVALRNHNGSKILDVTVEDIEDGPFAVPCTGMERKRYAIMRIGNHGYWNKRRSILGETARITVRNVRCSYSEDAIFVNNTLKDSVISNVRCTGRCASVVSLSRPELGSCGATMENVTIENCTVEPARPGGAVMDFPYLNPGETITNVRFRNCEVRTALGTMRYLDETISRRGGDPVPVAAYEGVEEKEGAIIPSAESGTFEVAPFRASSDDPVFAFGVMYRRTSLVRAEVAVAPDDGGAPGEWSAFAQTSSGTAIPVKAGGWVKYRIALRRENGVVPRFSHVKVGEIFQTRWSLNGGHSGKVFDVRAFGARGDGAAKDTKALQAAIDAAYAAGGGVVRVPPGRYVTGSIFLKSNVELNVCEGAAIVGSRDPADYNKWDVCPQNSRCVPENHEGGHLFLCVGQTNVTMRGRGIIDGSGDHFMTYGFDESRIGRRTGVNGLGGRNRQDAILWRPAQMLWFCESSGIRLEGLRVFNAPYWSVLLHGCENVSVSGLYVWTSRENPRIMNGDGINIDCCRHVRVYDCDIDTSDDSLCLRADGKRLLRSPAETADVRVENCRLSSRQEAFRIGVGDGSIHDCSISNCTIRASTRGINFSATWFPGRGCDFENIAVDGIVSHTTSSFLRVHRLKGRDTVVRGIRVSNVSGTQGLPSYIWSRKGKPFEDISLVNVDMDNGIEAVNVNGFRLDGGTLEEIKLTSEEYEQRSADIETFRKMLY